LHDDVVAMQLAVQNLDDDFASEQGLFAAIHGPETALADPPAQDEPSHVSPGKVRVGVVFGAGLHHPRVT
jgi:hypothetical protein